MYVVLLNYLKPLETIMALLPAHSDWLDTHYSAGIFIASGPQEPRTGGVILAHGVGIEALRKILDADPFHREGAAEYRIVEFAARKAIPELAAVLSRPSGEVTSG